MRRMPATSPDPPRPEPTGALARQPRLALAALLVGGLLLALALGEAVVRIVAPQDDYYAPPSQIARDPWRRLLHRPSSLPGLRYELAPGASARVAGALVTTNAHGMRDDEPLPADTPGLVRIVALGDSVTFGYGIEGSRAWPNALEQELAADPPRPDRRYEVLNLGVSGYSSADEAAQAEALLPVWRPRQVIVGYTLNDPETEAYQPLQAYYREPRAWQYSQLLRLLHRARRSRAVQRLGGGDYLRYLHAAPESWGSVVDAFARIGAAAANVGAEGLVAIFPTLPAPGESWSGYPHAGLHRQVADAARAAGLDALDLLPVLERGDPGSLRVSPADGHPNAVAQAWAAHAIAQHLRARGGPAFRVAR